MTIARELGERLRAYRTQRGWSQEEMAERADLHTTYIGDGSSTLQTLRYAKSQVLLSPSVEVSTIVWVVPSG